MTIKQLSLKIDKVYKAPYEPLSQSKIDKLYHILKASGSLTADEVFGEVLDGDAYGDFIFVDLHEDEPDLFIKIGAYYQAIGRRILVENAKSSLYDNDDNYFTVARTSKAFGVTDETVRRWIRKGDLKADIHSRKKGFLIRREDLKAFVDNNPKYRQKFGEE